MEVIHTTAESFHCLIKDILPWDLSSASFSGLDLVIVGNFGSHMLRMAETFTNLSPLSTIPGEGNISLRFLALVLITI